MEIRMRGITLVELLVVMSIIAILAVVGYPSYQTYLVESRRADAKVALRNNQFILEEYISENGITPTSGQVSLATISPNGFYTIAYTRVSDDRYKLVATAATGTSQTSDTGCTVMTLISEMDKIYPVQCD